MTNYNFAQGESVLKYLVNPSHACAHPISGRNINREATRTYQVKMNDQNHTYCVIFGESSACNVMRTRAQLSKAPLPVPKCPHNSYNIVLL